MKVFKFGGGSVKDASGVKNIATILKHEGYENTLIVVSAMGKMTNAFEKIVEAYCHEFENLKPAINFIETYHLAIVKELFQNKNLGIRIEIETLLIQLNVFLSANTSTDRNFIYDQIVGYGEMLSTKIISYYLNEEGFENSWIDVRNYIATDSNYREASVDWEISQKQITSLDREKLYITQGFIGRDNEGHTTTLGREGSDFSAAIFANCLNATKLIIWKDVPGLLNADPRYFEGAQLLEQISYREAIEMSNYGASVIHPKTVKPLGDKEIPLYVRSFLDFESSGTIISKKPPRVPEIPCFIVKKFQLLISISTLNSSINTEQLLKDLFNRLHSCRLKINLIQNSEISVELCIEDKFDTFQEFLTELKVKYEVKSVKRVDLYTLMRPNLKALLAIEQRGEVLLKQLTKETAQLIILE
jgi:aspartate kinase